MRSLQAKLHLILKAKFNPEYLEIIDDTYKHQGHLNTPYHEETHFTVFIVSQDFQAISRLERHQRIMTVLREFFETQLHALSIKALTSAEYQKFFEINGAPQKHLLQS